MNLDWKKTSKILKNENENKIIPPSIIISVTRLLFGGRVCSILCVTVGRCAAAVLRPLLAVRSNPLLALFHGAAVRSALSLPLADKSRVLLSYATFRHAQHPQAHDGGRLLGKLLRLLPENTNEFLQLKLWVHAGSACVCVLVRVRTDHSEDLYFLSATVTTDWKARSWERCT